jgi:hypothetical protein
MATDRIVSKKELEESGLSLRDFLNKERGLTRKAPEGTKFGVDKPRNPDAKAGSEVQNAGTRYVTPPHTPTPSPAKARSLVDQGRDVDIYKDVDRDAVLNAGLGLASVYPGTIAARTAYGVARPVVGAALKKAFSEDGLLPTFNRAEDPRPSTFETLSPENQAASQRYRSAYDDRPGPMKKGGMVKKMASGGKVSSASKRGDGIAQRGKTKGRMC